MGAAEMDTTETSPPTAHPPAAQAPPAPAHRRHRALVAVLLVAATISGLFGMFAVWANRQALNTDNWTDTSGQLLADPAIQDALGAYLVDQLFTNVDVTAQLQQVLPEQAQALAGPATAGLRQLAEQTAPDVLARPRVQQAWRQANTVAHEQLMRIIEGGGPVVSTTGGEVVLDVRALVDQLAATVGVQDQVNAAREKLQSSSGQAAVDAAQQKLGVQLPASAGQIVIMESDELETVQAVAKAIKGLAVILTVVSLALFALAVFLAKGWRRVALRSTGWCFVGLGLVVLFARRVLGERLVDALVPSDSVQPAAHAAWTIGTSLLYDIAAAMLVYGIVLVLASWLAGATRPAVAIRRAAAPALRDHVAASYGVVAVAFLLVLLWGPTPATRKLFGIVLLAALLVLGMEALRRQTAREFPDARSGEALQRLRERAAAVRLRRRPAEPAAPPPRTVPSVDELERLAALHDRGVLDDDEFRSQKELILHGS